MPITQKRENVFDAAKHNDLDAVKYFVQQDENILKIKNEEEKSVGLIAAENGNLEILKYVLEKDNSTLTCTDHAGSDAMLLAIEKGALNVVKYLVGHYQWDVHKKNSRRFGNTPIHEAARAGQLEILKYFLEEEGGYANVRNDLLDPPIFGAAEKPHMNIVKYLVEERNAYVNAINHHDDNILFQSAKTGDLILPKYLLEERREKFDVNWRNVFNYTLVYVSTRYDKTDFVEYMVTRHGANVNICDDKGMTPLHVAAFRNNHDICEFLIEHGANVEAKDHSNKTAKEVATSSSLMKYLEESTHKRSPRSVVPPVIFRSLPQLSSARWERRSLIPRDASYSAVSVEESFFVGTGSSRLTTFLTIANIIVRYFTQPRSTAERRRISEEQALLSPREISLLRLDPLAVDVVMNTQNTHQKDVDDFFQ